MNVKELMIGNYYQWNQLASMGKGIHQIKSGSDIDYYPEMKEGVTLTEQWMKDLGFYEAEPFWKTKGSDRKAWRKPVSDHENNWQFWEFHLNDYAADNPNCGILRHVYEETESHAIPPDLMKKQDWTDEEMKIAQNYFVTLEAHCHNIAHYIKYVHQLQNLYSSLNNGKQLTKS